MSKFYNRLLFVYPEPYRKKYGRQMRQTFDDMLADEPSRLGRGWLWLREIMLLPATATEQHLVVIAKRGGMQTRTILAILTCILLVPFFVAFFSEEIAERLFGGQLYHTWLWSPFVLLTWVFVLPLISLVLSLTAYAFIVARASKRSSRLMLQLRKSWMILAVAVVSLGILLLVIFHDSARCWTADPLGALTHLGSTLQCTTRHMVTIDKM